LWNQKQKTETKTDTKTDTKTETKPDTKSVDTKTETKTDSAPIIVGFLEKKGKGSTAIFGRRNWKKRWFEIGGGYLRYFEKKGGKKLNEIKYSSLFGEPMTTKVEPVESNERPFAFQLITKDRTLVMAASSEDERQKYIKILSEGEKK